LVTFFGTIDRRGDVTTIGDLMAVYNVALSLRRFVSHVDVAWHGNLFELNACRVDFDAIDRQGYDAVVYVCGPITRGHKKFFAGFPSTKKIAVGVSVTSGADPLTFIDAVYARDSESNRSFDLALADIGYPHFKAGVDVRDDRVAVCLVGGQAEYGNDDGHERAAALGEQASAGRKTVPVQTLLDQTRPIPASVEIDLQCASSLITTRMHGALLAIYHGVPVVSVDQIRGGAKVTRIVSQLEWPVFNAWTATPEQLTEELDKFQRSYPARQLQQARALLVKLSRKALEDATAFVLKELRSA
jgi:hypothetical protein